MSLTKATYAMIQGAAINVCDYGFSTTNTAAQNAAVIAGLLPENTNGIELAIPAGTYAIDPLVFENIFYVTIRGIGKVNLVFTAGTAAITIGNAARTKPVRRMILDNIRITASGTLTYGIRFLFGVDVTMYNVIIEDTATYIYYGLHIDYSWDNNFYGLIIKANDAVYLSSDNANKNSFFGGRFETTDPTHSTGIRTGGAANAFYGCDIEGLEYGVVVENSVGLTISGCYFEQNLVHDIWFDGLGATYGTIITGNYFNLRPNTTNSIYQEPTGNGSDGVVIQGNYFIGTPLNDYIVMNSLSNNWMIGGNSFSGSSNKYGGTNDAPGNWIQDLSGTWTPSYISTTGTPTTSQSSGKWIKNGRLVTAWFQIKGVAGSGSGSLAISGLPYTAGAALNGRGYAGSVSQALAWGTGTPTNIQKGAANTTIDLYTSAGVAITVANMGAGDNELVGMVTYYAAN